MSGVAITQDNTQAAGAAALFKQAGERIGASAGKTSSNDRSFAQLLDQHRVSGYSRPREVERDRPIDSPARAGETDTKRVRESSADATRPIEKDDAPTRAAGDDGPARPEASQGEGAARADGAEKGRDESVEEQVPVGEDQPGDEAGEEPVLSETQPVVVADVSIVNPLVQAEATQAASAQPQQAVPQAGVPGTQPTMVDPQQLAQAAAGGVAIVEPTGGGSGGDADASGDSSGDRPNQHLVAKPGQVAASDAANGPAATSPAASPAPGVVGHEQAPIQTASRVASPTTIGQPMQNVADAAGQSPEEVNVARVSRGLANAVQQRGGSVTLRLTPVDMGTVRIQLQMTGTTLSASFHAESSSAHALLTQQLSQLRQSLEGQGLTVERLSVQAMQAAPSHNAQSGSNSGGQQQDGTHQQQQPAHDGRSRGQYSQQQGSSNREARGESGADHDRPRGFNEYFDTTAADAA